MSPLAFRDNLFPVPPPFSSAIFLTFSSIFDMYCDRTFSRSSLGRDTKFFDHCVHAITHLFLYLSHVNPSHSPPFSAKPSPPAYCSSSKFYSFLPLPSARLSLFLVAAVGLVQRHTRIFVFLLLLLFPPPFIRRITSKIHPSSISIHFDH